MMEAVRQLTMDREADTNPVVRVVVRRLTEMLDADQKRRDPRRPSTGPHSRIPPGLPDPELNAEFDKLAGVACPECGAPEGSECDPRCGNQNPRNMPVNNAELGKIMLALGTALTQLKRLECEITNLMSQNTGLRSELRLLPTTPRNRWSDPDVEEDA